MYCQLKRHAQALLLGTLLGACGAPPEQAEVTPSKAPELFGRVRAPVTSASAETLSSNLLTATSQVFPSNQLPINGDSRFTDNLDANYLVQQNDTEVFVTYVSTEATLNSVLAYFTYPDGSPPTTAPSVTSANVVFSRSLGLATGTRVSLGVFNANTRIGLVLLPGAGGTTPNLSSPTRYYSLPSFNPSGGMYFTSKYYEPEQRRIIGIEDLPASQTTSYDMNDLLVSISSNPREKPRNVTICSHTFPNLTTGGWQHRDWVPSDCSAGLPPANAIPLGSGSTSNGNPHQQVNCTIQRGSHYYLGSGLTYRGIAFGPSEAYGTVTCAYLIPGDASDIRTCSYSWPDRASGVVRSRTWQASDCPQGLPDTGTWVIAEGQNDAGTSGQVNCDLTQGHHFNHTSVDGNTNGRVKCMYVKPTQSNNNITLCSKSWFEDAAGWRYHTWTAADCSNGLPKPGAASIAYRYNGNGTRGSAQCAVPSATQAAYGGHYNHPDMSGPTMGVLRCLYLNP